MAARFSWLGGVAGLACVGATSCTSTPTATIGITTGLELDALTRAPAPTQLVIDDIGLDLTVSELSRTTLPADTIPLGDKALTDVGALLVVANDATGKTLLRGQSLYVQFGALTSSNFSVFVQRVGELARFPNASAPLADPQLGITNARYLVAASGTATFLYDLLLLQTTAPLPALPRPAKSLAAYGTAAIAIDEVGATVLDLADGTLADVLPQPGGTFAEVAGGASVTATDESIFVVGGTRPTGATPRVFSVTAAGAISFAALAVARAGACAAYVDGRGLFVYGGGGQDAAGEILATGASIGTKLPFPADPVTGCGATALDGSHVLVVGGVGTPADPNAIAPSRVFDLACTTACAPALWQGALPLVRAEAGMLAVDAALVSGDDATGATHVFRVTPTGALEIPLKEARKGAHLIGLPVANAYAIVGGAASIEQYVE